MSSGQKYQVPIRERVVEGVRQIPVTKTEIQCPRCQQWYGVAGIDAQIGKTLKYTTYCFTCHSGFSREA